MFCFVSKMDTKQIISVSEWHPLQVREGVADEKRRASLESEIGEFGDKVFFGDDVERDGYTVFNCHIWNLHVHDDVLVEFKDKFRFELDGNVLNYNNLVNLVIMVKDAGEGFRDVLTQNLPYFDRWTVLDTGSTDNTVEIVKDVFKNKRGNLYEEPFINFRESRNRALELAGTECEFNIMLDDTYVLNGPLREFLEFVRGDDVADSFSLVIEDIDTKYTSNRITKSSRNLKYIHVIHEIIQTENNFNVSVPYANGYIRDINSEYTRQRTMVRKQNDIELLEKVYEEDPEDPRPLYYLGDSYLGLKDWENSIKYFKQRVAHPNAGFKSEVQDALYYIAVISDFYLSTKWEKCHQLYLNCYNYDQTRAESLYFVAKHYLDEGNVSLGFIYLKKAFQTGVPEITMSFRKNIYEYHIPFDLMGYCYMEGEYELGEQCCRRLVEYERQTELVLNWLSIFYHINKSVKNLNKTRISDKKLVCFVSPGGWKEWDGETLYTKGLGGSETFSIKYAEKLVELGYIVTVFCKCKKQKVFNDVLYVPLEDYIPFLNNYEVDVCIINRFPEYIPVTMFNNVRKTYYVLHDLASVYNIIPNDNRLSGILCISEWHKRQFCSVFPSLENKTSVISYGIETDIFPEKKVEEFTFIYPSFPNRGLVPLLQMFPKIVERYPQAKLHVFCDTKQEWVQKFHKPAMDQVDALLAEQTENVINHGWVKGEVLREYWSKAHVWFYPCIFEETCCLTSYEAAASKTLIVSNHLAALKESVGDRGIIIAGNPMEEGWQILALNRLFNVLEGVEKTDHVERNYNWILNKSFSIVVSDFVKKYIDN